MDIISEFERHALSRIIYNTFVIYVVVTVSYGVWRTKTEKKIGNNCTFHYFFDRMKCR